MKTLILTIGLLQSTAALAYDEMRWFRNDMTCADARVTVQAFCADQTPEPNTVHSNSLCSRQTLVIERAGRAPIKRDLLRHHSKRDQWLIVSSLRCVAATGKPYLYGLMNNGGNCDACERDIVLDLDGGWKHFGKRWFVSGPERRLITASEDAWFRATAFYLKNTTRDTTEGE